MGPQRYERVSESDHEDSHIEPPEQTIPNSPPPSFRSRASSPVSRPLLSEDPVTSDADRTLSDAFDNGFDSDVNEDDDEGGRQRLIRGNAPPGEENHETTRPGVERAVTQLPRFVPTVPAETNRVYGSGGQNPFSLANDGVFANLNAKPERGEKLEEQPPSYEQAAADATPPYWENTILTPGLASGDEVFVEGLPVGSLFSFVWNGMISISFQLVGFLLTYLLHTTHAAKNGSRAGLGITLVQYGFYMRSSASTRDGSNNNNNNNKTPSPDDMQYTDPTYDPATILADPVQNTQAQVAAAAAENGSNTSTGGLASLASSEWFAYALMIAGWFILIRAISDYCKARRHEQLVLQSPDRGVSGGGIVEGERVESVV